MGANITVNPKLFEPGAIRFVLYNGTYNRKINVLKGEIILGIQNIRRLQKSNYLTASNKADEHPVFFPISAATCLICAGMTDPVCMGISKERP